MSKKRKRKPKHISDEEMRLMRKQSRTLSVVNAVFISFVLIGIVIGGIFQENDMTVGIVLICLSIICFIYATVMHKLDSLGYKSTVFDDDTDTYKYLDKNEYLNVTREDRERLEGLGTFVVASAFIGGAVLVILGIYKIIISSL